MDSAETIRSGAKARGSHLAAAGPWRLSGPARLAALAAGLLLAEALGYALAWTAGRFGNLAPIVLLGLVGVPAFLFLVAHRPRAGAAAVFLLFPIGVVNLAGLVDIIQLAAIGIGGLVILTRLRLGRLALPAPIWWLVGLLGWMFVSLPFAIDKPFAVREMSLLITALVWVMLLVVVCPRSEDARRMTTPLLTVMAIGAAISTSAWGNAQPLYGGSIVNGRAVGFIGDPNSWGTLCMMAALLAIALALGGAPGRWRSAARVAALVLVAGLLLSYSRGAWIGFAIGLVVLACSLHQARRVLLVVGLSLVPLSVVMGVFPPDAPQVEALGERFRSIVGEKGPYEYRPDAWAEARRQIIDRPLVGQGPGGFLEASRRSTSLASAPIAGVHAHNFLLTWGAEVGLPAVALLVGLSVHVALLARRARRRAWAAGRGQDVALLAGLTAALAGMAGQGLVDYTLRNSVVCVAVAGVLGLLLAHIRAVEAQV